MAAKILFPQLTDRLSFFLAAEEYLMSKEGEFFFLWQSAPTVIYGANQVLSSEVDEAFAREKGIALVQRLSGGGTVYSDKGNLMVSLVCDSVNVEDTFSRYMSLFSNALHKVGIDARVTGRNDIAVLHEGTLKKVSGNAFYKKGSRAVVHGTLMFDVDLQTLSKVLTPSREKLSSKGVASTRSRVANLAGITDAGMPEIREALYAEFCSDSIMLSPADIEAIETIEKTYLRREGRESREFDMVSVRYIDGVGEVRLHIQTSDGLIKKVHLGGDYFQLRPGVDEYLTAALSGIPSDSFELPSLKDYLLHK